jgi:hypothetical protein
MGWYVVLYFVKGVSVLTHPDIAALVTPLSASRIEGDFYFFFVILRNEGSILQLKSSTIDASLRSA